MDAVANIFTWFWTLSAPIKILIVSLIVADISFSTLYGVVGKYKKLYKVLFPGKKKSSQKRASGRHTYRAGKTN